MVAAAGEDGDTAALSSVGSSDFACPLFRKRPVRSAAHVRAVSADRQGLRGHALHFAKLHIQFPLLGSPTFPS
jgi:hypothetical protein